MTEVVLSVASNAPNRRQMVDRALEWLTGVIAPLRTSFAYTTPAHHGQSTYLNVVATGYCAFSLPRLQSMLKDYERAAGRTPEVRATHLVPIDVDVVMWEGEILKPKDFHQEFFQKGWQDLQRAE